MNTEVNSASAGAFLAMVGSVSVCNTFLRSAIEGALRSLSSTASISLSTMPQMRFDEEWKWVRNTRSGSGDPVHQPQSIIWPYPPPGLPYGDFPQAAPQAF